MAMMPAQSPQTSSEPMAQAADRPSAGLQAVAVLLAVLGSCVVKPKPWLALLLYAAAGSCLAWAQWGRTPALPLEERPRARRQAWEPWFFLALMGLGLLSFGWHLGSIPEGANYSEGELAVRAGVVDRLPNYLAHDAGEICWPTLYHYEGILPSALGDLGHGGAGGLLFHGSDAHLA
jgi:hypothetical protein